MYTDSDHCKNQDELDESAWGPDFGTDFTGAIDKHEITVGQWEIFEEVFGPKTPPHTLNVGNLDSTRYA